MKQNSKSLWVLLALSFFLSCAQAPQQLVSEKLVAPTADLTSEKIRDAIVLIESENESSTGFFVGADKIATNIHAVAHPGPVSVKSPDTEKSWTIKGVVAFDAKNSLVLLKIAGEGTPLPLGNSDTLETDEPVSILDYSDRKFKVTEGSIQGIRKNNKWFRVKTPTSKSTNGSPVFNNKGQVIGVIVPYGGYAVSSSTLVVLLDTSLPIEPLAVWQQRKPVRAAAYYSLGVEKSEAKDYAGAVVDLDKAIELNRDYLRAYYERGRAQFYLGNPDGAIASCTQVIKMEPDAADAYYGRGTIKASLGNYAEAIVDLDKAIELDAQHADAYRNRGGVKFRFGESETARGNAEAAQRLYEEAIADCDKAVQIDPDDADSYNIRGVGKLFLDDFKGAILDFNRTLQIDSEDATAYRNRGAAKIHFGDFEDERGDAEEARRLYEEAIADCNEALQIDSEDAIAYRNRGAAKDSLGDFEGARGNIKEAQGLYEETIADCNKAIQINLRYADAYNSRAIVKCKLADIEFEYGDAEIAQSLYHEGVTDYHKSIQLNNQEDTDTETANLDSEIAINSTVLVLAWSGISNRFFNGSGFFVDKNRIVTNIHVVDLPGPIFAKRSDEETIWAVEGVVAFDVKNDLVVLKLAGEGIPLLLGDSDAVKSGEAIMAVGYPNKKYKAAHGTIHSIRNSDKRIRMNIDTAGGSSGSPVLNSNGQVVGVDVSTVNINGESYALAIPSNALKALLTTSGSMEFLMEWQDRDHIRAYAYHSQGRDKFDADDYQAAIADFDEAIKLNPRNFNTYHKRGRAKSAFDRHKAAIVDFDKAIRLNAEAVYIYAARGNAKHALGDYEGAVADLDKVIQLYPECAGLYRIRGAWKVSLNDLEGAIFDYNEAIRINPEYAQAYYDRGEAKETLGQKEAAKADFDKAKELDPDVGQ